MIHKKLLEMAVNDDHPLAQALVEIVENDGDEIDIVKERYLAHLLESGQINESTYIELINDDENDVDDIREDVEDEFELED